LSDSAAIRDCLMRYARGIYRFDRELILSAFHMDFIDKHGKFGGTREEFAAWALDQHARTHLRTQHYLLNHRCELDGDTAHTETYFMFVGINRQGKPLQMNGGRHIDRFERRDSTRAIAYRELLRVWANLNKTPDMSDLSSFTSTRALLSPQMKVFMNGGPGLRRDRGDRSYARPLTGDPTRIEQYRKLKD
jgi:SnoaL-like domain